VRKKKAGKKVKAGFPRFKSIDRYRSITYPQNNGSFSIEKKRKIYMLRVSGIGRMKIELNRPIEGKIKTPKIKKKADEYFAIFATVKEVQVPEVADTNPVGIDMGLNSFVALSDGTKIEKPNFAKKSAKHIARWQRIVSRRNKGSKNRDKAKQKLQRKCCGLTIDRDINSALVIKKRMEMLKRATAGQAGSNASGDATSTIQQVSQVASMNQEHTLQPFVAGEAHDL